MENKGITAKPFTLESYEAGKREAWTRKGKLVTVSLRTGIQSAGWPMEYKRHTSTGPTHVTRNGTMFRTNEETIFDIFETDPTVK